MERHAGFAWAGAAPGHDQGKPPPIPPRCVPPGRKAKHLIWAAANGRQQWPVAPIIVDTLVCIAKKNGAESDMTPRNAVVQHGGFKGTAFNAYCWPCVLGRMVALVSESNRVSFSLVHDPELARWWAGHCEPYRGGLSIDHPWAQVPARFANGFLDDARRRPAVCKCPPNGWFEAKPRHGHAREGGLGRRRRASKKRHWSVAPAGLLDFVRHRAHAPQRPEFEGAIAQGWPRSWLSPPSGPDDEWGDSPNLSISVGDGKGNNCDCPSNGE